MAHDPKTKKGIKILADGPYEVSGGVPLNRATIVCDGAGAGERWGKEETYETKEPYHLCRCGQSRTKPFCDGTHEDAGFCGRERPDREPYAERASRQEGATVDLMDDEKLCVGARFCDRGESVWNYVDESDDPEKRALAIREAGLCPSGRLTAVTKEGEALEPKLPQEISLVEDPARNCRGPLWVQGGIPIRGANGEAYETRNRVTLCRCGESSNMPYCDGAHYGCQAMQGED